MRAPAPGDGDAWSVELDRAAKRARLRERFAGEVDLRVGRDVAFLARVLENRRQIEVPDRDVAVHRLPRREDVREYLSVRAPRGRLDVHLDTEMIQRTV